MSNEEASINIKGTLYPLCVQGQCLRIGGTGVYHRSLNSFSAISIHGRDYELGYKARHIVVAGNEYKLARTTNRILFGGGEYSLGRGQDTIVLTNTKIDANMYTVGSELDSLLIKGHVYKFFCDRDGEPNIKIGLTGHKIGRGKNTIVIAGVDRELTSARDTVMVDGGTSKATRNGSSWEHLE